MDDVMAKGLDERKQRMRAQMRQLRSELAGGLRASADDVIKERLCSLQAYREADVLLTYLSFGSEVDTRGIIEQAWASGKVVALPRCVPRTHHMQWYRVDSFDGLVRSRFGVEEPVPDPSTEQHVNTRKRMLALVPGLAFDSNGFRLGYGGGFYDTFLADFSGVSIGLCREALLHENLQDEGVVALHDLPVQMVVTEGRVISARTELFVNC